MDLFCQTTFNPSTTITNEQQVQYPNQMDFPNHEFAINVGDI
jgi:hypothetical protein